MASGLREMGISIGDVILILLPNSIYFPIIFLAILSLGAIVTTMNPLSSPTEIEKQMRDCNACLAFIVSEKVEIFRELGIPVIELPEDLNSQSTRTDYPAFFELLSCNPELPPMAEIKQEDTAAIVYSSGTTGSSKGVVLTHQNFIAMVALFPRFEASQYPYSSSDNVYLALVPMFHIYGLSLFLMGLVSLGCCMIVMKKYDVEEMVRTIDEYGVTHFPIVPPLLNALTQRAKGVDGSRFRSLKQVSCGAAPASKTIIQEFIKTLPHVDFIQGYGLTESTAVGTRGFNTERIHKYSSIGLLAPNMEAKVVNWDTGSFQAPGNTGELWLRGPSIMKGYLNNVEATMLTIDKDGWLHTGDIVYFDQDGYLYIIDRLKEIIKYKGFQIAPVDLEVILISHPDIDDAAVTALADKEAGEVPVAFVVRRQGSALSEEAVKSHVAKQVAPYKKLKKVIFTHSIPKSPSGKILRRELKNKLSSRI